MIPFAPILLLSIIFVSCAGGSTGSSDTRPEVDNRNLTTATSLYGAWQYEADLPEGFSHYLQLLPDKTFSTLWHHRIGSNLHHESTTGTFEVTPKTRHIVFQYKGINRCGTENDDIDAGKKLSYSFENQKLVIIFAEDPDREKLPGERPDGRSVYRHITAIPPPPSSSTEHCYPKASL